MFLFTNIKQSFSDVLDKGYAYFAIKKSSEKKTNKCFLYSRNTSYIIRMYESKEFIVKEAGVWHFIKI